MYFKPVVCVKVSLKFNDYWLGCCKHFYGGKLYLSYFVLNWLLIMLYRIYYSTQYVCIVFCFRKNLRNLQIIHLRTKNVTPSLQTQLTTDEMVVTHGRMRVVYIPTPILRQRRQHTKQGIPSLSISSQNSLSISYFMYAAVCLLIERI